MGKDQKAPPPPDYGPIVQANKEAAEFSFKTAQDQLAWAKQTYKDNKKTSDVFTDFVFGQMDRQADWATRDRERYETVFQPLEEQLAADAESYASPQRQEYEAGKAEADVANQYEQARQTAQEKLESYGVDPTQTRSSAMDLQTRVAEAAAQAAAGTGARERAEATGRQLRTEAINVGKGYPAQVATSESGAQGAGQSGVSSGLQTTASGAATQGTAPQWQSAGQGSLNSWGSMVNQGYQDQLNAWKSEQSQSSGAGGLFGTVAGIGMKLAGFDGGGVVPEYAGGGMTGGDVGTPGGGPVPVSRSPSRGVVPDDIAAVVDGQGPAKLTAGEFVIPDDVMKWKGEEWAQKEILKARTQMSGQNGERPAQPSVGPPVQ